MVKTSQTPCQKFMMFDLQVGLLPVRLLHVLSTDTFVYPISYKHGLHPWNYASAKIWGYWSEVWIPMQHTNPDGLAWGTQSSALLVGILGGRYSVWQGDFGDSAETPFESHSLC